MGSEERHWTDNDELIDRFILDQLEPGERNELEDHLRICEVCKHAVRTHQKLIAGIRRSGREHFKSRLQRKIYAAPQRKTPWMHILSAAAIILIITSIGIYNQWFQLHLSDERNVVEISPQVLDSVDANQKNQTTVPETAASQEHVTAISASPETEGTAQSGNQQISESSKSTEQQAKPQSIDEPASQVAGAAAPMIQSEDFQTDAAAADLSVIAPAENEIWLEGTIIFTESEELSRDLKRRQQPNTMLLNKVDSGSAKASSETDRAKQSDRLFSLTQEHASNLPSAQQRLHELRGEKLITRARFVGGKTQLTFYPDSPIDGNDLANATTEVRSTDSLVVHLSGQRVVYKLPSEWHTRMQRKPAK